MNVDSEKFKQVSLNNYGNVTIMGDISTLDFNTPYKITGVETKGKYGMSYKVISCRRDKPTTSEETYTFLKSILTLNQANELYKNYPNVIDMVLNDEPIDLSIVKGIVIRKMYDKYASIEKVRAKVLDDPYKFLCDLSGIGFKTADAMLLDFQKNNTINFGYDLMTSKQRCRSCILYTLKENENNGSTRVRLEELNEQVKTLTPECSNKFVECLKEDDIYCHVDNENHPYVSIKSTYETEKYIYDRIINANKFKEVYDCNYKDYTKIDEAQLTEIQSNALKNLCENQFSILVGYSGTGKSFSVQGILNMLNDLGKNFTLLAPTGKASKVLGNYTGVDAQTIHRGLGYIPPKWTYNEEVSMTDIFLFKRVLEAIDFRRTKMLIIGDPAQLPSVACGNLLHDLLSIKELPCTKLTEVFRYNDGGLMKVATDVRNSVQYLKKQKDDKKKMMVYGDNKDYTFINADKLEGINYLVTIYKRVLESYKPDEVTVLSCYRKGDFGSVALNGLLQPLANPHDVHVTVKNQEFYIGDIVMQTVNNREAVAVTLDEQFGNKEWVEYKTNIFLANGETGVIKDITDDLIVIDFNDVLIGYSREDMQNVSLAYAITCHKSQGSQNKVIILFTPSSHTYMLNSNIIYVGLTRMQEKVFHIGDINTVNRAVLKKENFERDTWLKELKNI